MKRIEVVSDNETIMEMIQISLMMEEYEVRAIPISQYRLPGGEQVPDLILIDVSQRTQEGKMLCQQLKNSGHTRHIPLIFLFERFDHFDEKQALEEKYIDDCILKPFHLPDFIRMVRKYTSSGYIQ